jgi:hypothetical protein
MAKHKREAKGKKINPTFFIFCEGESEETYIRHVRAQYRIPVEIVPKITRNQVSERKIRESIKNSPRHEKDKIYLMYDIDVTGFLSKLETIKKQIKSELIVSNPCFELWYILHFMSQTAEISTDDCIKRLETLCPSYKKGDLPAKLRAKLEEKKTEAIKRAKKQAPYQNPSTNMHLFLEELDKVKK